jgi:hypothetical protein
MIRLENRLSGSKGFNQFDFSCLSLQIAQLTKQNLELQFCRGRLIYTKSGVFGLSYSEKMWLNPKVIKICSIFEPRGDQVKSNNYIIEHSPVIVGQWSPSSSEEG